MLPVKYLCSNKSSFCVSRISWSSQNCHKVVVSLIKLSFEDITRFKTVVSVCRADSGARKDSSEIVRAAWQGGDRKCLGCVVSSQFMRLEQGWHYDGRCLFWFVSGACVGRARFPRRHVAGTGARVRVELVCRLVPIVLRRW